jgi:hypothetical protein
MKTLKTPIGLILAASQILAGTCLALTPVEDNFNAATLNASRWQIFNYKNARMRHLDDRLKFSVFKSSGGEDYSYAELVNNQPGSNENWQLFLDVKNASGKGDDAGVGFWIFNADDPRDVIFFEFYGNPGKARRESVCACFVVDGQHLAQELSLKQKATTRGKLKINYSATTKRFTFFFRKSEKGAWANMGSFSVNGVGGDVRANWNMNPGSGRFGIRLEGFSEKKAVAAGDLTMDNFVLQAPQ